MESAGVVLGRLAMRFKLAKLAVLAGSFFMVVLLTLVLSFREVSHV